MFSMKKISVAPAATPTKVRKVNRQMKKIKIIHRLRVPEV